MIAVPMIIMFFLGMVVYALLFNKPLRTWAQKKLAGEKNDTRSSKG